MPMSTLKPQPAPLPATDSHHQCERVGSSVIQFILLTHPSKVTDPDADVIFRSSDGILFHLHRANLKTGAAGFSPDLIICPPVDGFVNLTETAATLKLLFAFLYPKRHPTLVAVEFSTLALVAEAAEKYEVYAAMNICLTRMRYVYG